MPISIWTGRQPGSQVAKVSAIDLEVAGSDMLAAVSLLASFYIPSIFVKLVLNSIAYHGTQAISIINIAFPALPGCYPAPRKHEQRPC